MVGRTYFYPQMFSSPIFIFLCYSYDVGVYFEANGHGTVIFSDLFKTRVSSYTATPSGLSQQDDRRNLAYSRLQVLI